MDREEFLAVLPDTDADAAEAAAGLSDEERAVVRLLTEQADSATVEDALFERTGEEVRVGEELAEQFTVLLVALKEAGFRAFRQKVIAPDTT